MELNIWDTLIRVIIIIVVTGMKDADSFQERAALIIHMVRISRTHEFPIEFWPKGERDYIESSTAPIMGSETNYTYNTGVLNTMNNYWGRRLTSGMRNSLSTVAVKWRRSGDNQELTANYNITVMSPVPT